jgi:hypothetical protein
LRKFAFPGLVALATIAGTTALGLAGPVASASAAMQSAATVHSSAYSAFPAVTSASASASIPASTPAPAQTVSTVIVAIDDRISCGSASACLLVGAHLGSKNVVTPLAQAWNGKAWKTVPVPLPKGASRTDIALQDVSCKAATACLVIGESETQAGQLSYAMFWNGSVLTPVASPPQPKGAGFFGFEAVSCLGPKSCVVVGSTMSSSGSFLVLTDTWNGSKWTESTAPAPGGDETSFTSLRCFSLTACYAAGDGYTSSGVSTVLIAAWNGKTWTAQPAVTPSGAKSLFVSSISCASPGSCAAVGVSISFNAKGTAVASSFGFAEVWNGKAWTVTKWAGAKGDTEAILTGVSCTSAASCVAVGAAGTAKTGAAASLHYNGTKWTVVKVPSVGAGKSSAFEDVSCVAAGHCVAGGEYGPPGSNSTTLLAGYWNGTSWKLGKA